MMKEEISECQPLANETKVFQMLRVQYRYCMYIYIYVCTYCFCIHIYIYLCFICLYSSPLHDGLFLGQCRSAIKKRNWSIWVVSKQRGIQVSSEEYPKKRASESNLFHRFHQQPCSHLIWVTYLLEDRWRIETEREIQHDKQKIKHLKPSLLRLLVIWLRFFNAVGCGMYRCISKNIHNFPLWTSMKSLLKR